ncbi:hypothetical protein JCM5350_008349 [Sporobolomyces pararoseus]
MSRPLPTLPLEIILEILRDYDLSDSDLARLCLVSRKILESVRLRLYERIEVSFVNPEEPSSDPLLDSSTWRLLRTLQDNPELSLLVEMVDFKYIRLHPVSPSRISLSIPQAVSLFLKLVPNFSSVTICNGFRDSLTQMLQVVGNFAEKIQQLCIFTVIEREHNLQAMSLPRLKILAVSHLYDDTGSGYAGLDRLQLLLLSHSIPPNLRGGLLERSKPNLRDLGINAGAACTLDYSEFSQLRCLLLKDYKGSRYASIRHARGRPNFNKFWSKLRRAPPSLEVLSFDGEPYEDGLEEDLFGNSIRTGIQLQNILRIRFEGSIPLERIARLIHAPLLPNLRQVVVNYSPRKGESTAERLSRIEAASTLCSARGIDLLLRGWTG